MCSFFPSMYDARLERVIIDILWNIFFHGIHVKDFIPILVIICVELILILLVFVKITQDDTWVDNLTIVEWYRKNKRERERRCIEKQMEKLNKKKNEDETIKTRTPNLSKMSKKKRKEYMHKLERQKQQKNDRQNS